MSANQAAYFKALGIKAPPTKRYGVTKAADETTVVVPDPEQKARLAALNRSHEIRQFEIELYWKRATYFWVLQAAVFTALGLMWKDGASSTAVPRIIPVALGALGLLTAAAGWFSAQGSKFWQENWERHIDMLEDEFEGKLHKTAWIGRIGVRWSVSAVNDRLILFFVVFWFLVFVMICASAVPVWTWAVASPISDGDFTLPQVIMLALATMGGLWSLYAQKSNLRGVKPGWEVEPSLNEIQPTRPRLFKSMNDAPFIMKRGQSK